MLRGLLEQLRPIYCGPDAMRLLWTRTGTAPSAAMTLKEVLSSGGIKHLVMAGVATSSVILSTFTLGADEDYSITILSAACADTKASLHEELMTNLFPRSAKVLTVDQWIASLPTKG